MGRLQGNMAAITDLSANISDALAPRRERIAKLSSAHLTLKKVPCLSIDPEFICLLRGVALLYVASCRHPTQVGH